MKKRSDSELSKEKWRNNSSDGDLFSKHFGLIHLAGWRVLKHFLGFVHLFIISPLFQLSSSLLFHLLVSPLTCLFTCLASSLFLSSLFSSLDLLLSFLVSPLTCLFTCLASSLFFSRLSSFIFSFLLFDCLVFSFLVLSSLFFSCLVLSLFLCLSLSLSVSLCLSLSLSLSPCGVVCCGVVWCVWCPRVCVQKRLRVYVQNASVCAGTTPACVTTCGLGAGTHGDVLNLHTEVFGTDTRRRGGERRERGGTVSSANHETAHVELSRALERFTVRNPWFLPIQGLRKGREQHVPESSNHSLYLMKLLSSIFHPEGHCGRNQHTQHAHTHQHTLTNPPTTTPLPSLPSPSPSPSPRKRTCTCTCIRTCTCSCVCVYMHM